MIKIVIPGKPMSKSNSKAIGKHGKSYIPDEYKAYEELIGYCCKNQYNGEQIDEQSILVLKLYFADNRIRDVHNYPKSICDGLEKSGLISNDKFFKPVIIQEFKDKENPRAEVEIYPSSEYNFDFILKVLNDKSYCVLVDVPGNPISKSNFKLNKKNGKGWMPTKGKYRKYNDYEMIVGWECMQKHKGAPIDEDCILVMKLFFDNKRNRDIHNYPKSICDGIEKGGTIKNDSLFKEIVIIDGYDKENPRVELAICPKSNFKLKYNLTKKRGLI